MANATSHMILYDRYESRSFVHFFLGVHNVPAKKHQEHNKQLQHLQDISMSSMSLFRCLAVDLWKTPWVIWFSGCQSLAFEHTTSYDHRGVWLMVASYTVFWSYDVVRWQCSILVWIGWRGYDSTSSSSTKKENSKRLIGLSTILTSSG